MKSNRDKKIKQMMFECFRELYKNSTPTANFDDLPYMDKTSTFYNDYEIEEDKLEEIIENVMDKYNLPQNTRKQFRPTIYLGPSPKTKFKCEK